MEKKIINPADIWTTLRLPTRVKASKPAFSLWKSRNMVHLEKEMENTQNVCNVKFPKSYTDTDDPFAVPNNPSSKMPTPYFHQLISMSINWYKLVKIDKLATTITNRGRIMYLPTNSPT